MSISAAPGSVHELLEVCAQHERATARRTAQQLDPARLGAAACTVLEQLRSVPWQGMTHAVSIAPGSVLDRLQVDSGLTAPPRSGHGDARDAFDIGLVMRNRPTDGSLVDAWEGDRAAAWSAGEILVSEVWLHPGPATMLDALPATPDVRRRASDGAVHARLAEAVSATGARAIAVHQRPDAPAGDVAPTVLQPEEVAGRISAATVVVHRLLGLPTPAPTPRPWMSLLGRWAQDVARDWEQWLREGGSHHAAVQAMQARPDLVVMAEQVRASLQGAVPGRVHRLADAQVATRAVLEEGPESAEQLARQAAELLPAAGWAGVAAVVRSRQAVGAGERAGWWDGPGLLVADGRVMDVPEARSRLARLALLDDVPSWFLGALTRVVDVAAAATV